MIFASKMAPSFKKFESSVLKSSCFRIDNSPPNIALIRKFIIVHLPYRRKPPTLTLSPRIIKKNQIFITACIQMPAMEQNRTTDRKLHILPWLDVPTLTPTASGEYRTETETRIGAERKAIGYLRRSGY